MATDLSNIDASNLTDEQIMEMELGFFKKLKAVDLNRDYTVIVDRSGSMGGPNWSQAREAVEFLAPHACKCDPDGITLFFFDYEVMKFENIKTSGGVLQCFNKVTPRGSTNLALALTEAIQKANGGCFCFGEVKSKPLTILVITDGTPDNKAAVENVIIDATKNHMTVDDDLSITIIQVGNDSGADEWLKELDEGLTSKGASFDIVDVMSVSMMKGISFSDLIKKSLSD